MSTLAPSMGASGSLAPRREKTGSFSTTSKDGETNNDDLPLAIQTFLWRQTRFVILLFISYNNNQSIRNALLGTSFLGKRSFYLRNTAGTRSLFSETWTRQKRAPDIKRTRLFFAPCSFFEQILKLKISKKSIIWKLGVFKQTQVSLSG